MGGKVWQAYTADVGNRRRAVIVELGGRDGRGEWFRVADVEGSLRQRLALGKRITGALNKSGGEVPRD